MTEIRFYHLSQKSLSQALPELLEKVLERGWRAVVMASSSERVEALTQSLWTYKEGSFLPHGNARDGHAELQPIWLTERDENPNKANVLMLTENMSSDDLSSYELVCQLFDESEEGAVEAARARWQEYKEQGHALTYWQQSERGWEKRTAEK
jgi:DNA polymerase III subunit chi